MGPYQSRRVSRPLDLRGGVRIFDDAAQLEQADLVARGEDPLGVIRDEARNTPWITIAVEQHLGYSLAGAPASAAYDYPDAKAEAEPALR